MDVVTVAERPELVEPAWERTSDVLPEYNNHGDVSGTLPAGIDGAIARGFDEGAVNVLCALVVMVPRDRQGRGLSAGAVEGMLELARRQGLNQLIAPVRPSWKERYPFVPIQRYAAWRREDGLLFDPWMRVHERLGATILKPEPQSLRITGTVAEWEEWTGMVFPESGDYWFPRGLATLAIDREADRGSYWEPNVWMEHLGEVRREKVVPGASSL
jgi:hypothetical protein